MEPISKRAMTVAGPPQKEMSHIAVSGVGEEIPEVNSGLASDESVAAVSTQKEKKLTDNYDQPHLLRGKPEPKQRGVKKIVSHNSDVWMNLVRRLEQYIIELMTTSITDNLGNIQEAGKIYSGYRNQFPNSVTSQKAYFLLVFYNA